MQERRSFGSAPLGRQIFFVTPESLPDNLPGKISKLLRVSATFQIWYLEHAMERDLPTCLYSITRGMSCETSAGLKGGAYEDIYT